jgi:hypothetical protein
MAWKPISPARFHALSKQEKLNYSLAWVEEEARTDPEIAEMTATERKAFAADVITAGTKKSPPERRDPPFPHGFLDFGRKP